MAWWIWLCIAVGLILVESFTLDLVAIWFAAAAAVLTIVSAVFPQLFVVWEILIFLVVSAGLLLSTRKLVKKLMKRGDNQETNLELLLNHTGVVVESIDNDAATGAVKINGLVWSARSAGGEQLSEGELVVILQIQGNKLIVAKKQKEEHK